MTLSLKQVLLVVFVLYGALFFVRFNDYDRVFLFHADANEYVTLAHNIVDHHLFSRDLQAPEIIRTPGYPAFLAVTMAVAGERSFYYLVVLVQTLLVGGTAYLTYRMGKTVFDSPRLGTVAAAVYVLMPTTFFYAFSGMTETLFTFLLIAALSLVAPSHIPWRNALVAGIVLGLAILVRPIALLSPIILLPMAMRTQWRNGVWFLAGLLVVLTPWVARNVHDGYGVTVSSIGSLNLAHGNAAKFYAWQNHVSEARGLEVIEQEVDETSRSRPTYTAAQAHEAVALYTIRTNLSAYALFHLVKTVPFFTASSIKGVALNLHLLQPSQRTADLLLRGGDVRAIAQKLVAELPYTLESAVRAVLTVFMSIAAWRAWKTRNAFALLLFALVLLFALLTSPWSETRLRVPYEPYMLLLAFSVFFTRTKMSSTLPTAERLS